MTTLQELQRIRGAHGERLQIPGGPYVGKLVGRIAYFRVHRSRHFYRIWNSWTLDKRIVQSLQGRADSVIFDDTENSETWETSLENFRDAKPTTNRTGTKLAVAERHWHKIGEDDSEQPTLFDMPSLQQPNVYATA